MLFLLSGFQCVCSKSCSQCKVSLNLHIFSPPFLTLNNKIVSHYLTLVMRFLYCEVELQVLIRYPSLLVFLLVCALQCSEANWISPPARSILSTLCRQRFGFWKFPLMGGVGRWYMGEGEIRTKLPVHLVTQVGK